MRHSDLLRRVERIETVGPAQEAFADVADQAVESTAAEIELSVAEMRHGEINRIEDALRKIGEGTYGVCEACGREIPAARLRMLPNATMCVSCQHETERVHMHEEGSGEEWERLPGHTADDTTPVSACAGSKF